MSFSVFRRGVMIFSFVDHVYRVNIRTPVLPDKMPMRASTDDARTESIPIPFSVHAHCLRTGLLLLLLPQSEQTDTGNLDDLESHTGNITLGLALTTETSQEHLVVLVHEVQATVVGDCCSITCQLITSVQLDLPVFSRALLPG